MSIKISFGKEAKDQVLGRSRGGLTTKIHMFCDTLGRPLQFLITPGQASDITAALLLFSKARRPVPCSPTKPMIAMIYASRIADMKAEAVIPSKHNRKVAIPHDTHVYKQRNRIERCFNRLKHFHRFATRYDRRAIHFTGLVHLERF